MVLKGLFQYIRFYDVHVPFLWCSVEKLQTVSEWNAKVYSKLYLFAVFQLCLVVMCAGEITLMLPKPQNISEGKIMSEDS